MNIIENNVIDWSMFGLAMKNYRRNKGLDPEQFADFMNRMNGVEKPIITPAVVERIEAGKTKPSLDQLNVLDHVVAGESHHIANAIGLIADGLMFSNGSVATVPTDQIINIPQSPVAITAAEAELNGAIEVANAGIDFSTAPEL